MNEGRLETVKEGLRKLEHGDYYDTHDFSIALSETGQIALELVEEIERLGAFEARATSLLKSKRQTMKIVDPAIEEAKRKSEWMLVAKIEIEKFKLQAEIDLLEYVVNV